MIFLGFLPGNTYSAKHGYPSGKAGGQSQTDGQPSVATKPLICNCANTSTSLKRCSK